MKQYSLTYKKLRVFFHGDYNPNIASSITELAKNGGILELGVVLRQEIEPGTYVVDKESGLPFTAIHFVPDAIDPRYRWYGHALERIKKYVPVDAEYAHAKVYSTYDRQIVVDVLHDIARYVEKHGEYPKCHLCDAFSISSAYIYRLTGNKNDETVVFMAIEMLKPKSIYATNVPELAVPLIAYKLERGIKVAFGEISRDALEIGVEPDRVSSYDMIIAKSSTLQESEKWFNLATSHGASLVLLSSGGMFGAERTVLYSLAMKNKYRYLSTPHGSGLAILVPQF